MKKRMITIQQLNRLVGDLRAIPPRPEGEHLSDDDFVDYSAAALSPEEIERVDRHLASCSRCAAEMDHLLDASMEWTGPQGEARLDALRVKIRKETAAAVAAPTGGIAPGPSLRGVAIKVLARFSIPVSFAPALAGDEWEHGYGAPDGSVKYSMKRCPDRSLVIDLSSNNPDYADQIVSVSQGEWSAETAFTSGFEGQLEASVTVDSSVAKEWDENVTLVIRVIPNKPA